MVDYFYKFIDVISKFEKCKVCKKKYYKLVYDVDVSFEYKLLSIELILFFLVLVLLKVFNLNSLWVKFFLIFLWF